MLKKLFPLLTICLCLFAILTACYGQNAMALPRIPPVNKEAFNSILKENDVFLRQKKLIAYIKGYVQIFPGDKLTALQDTLNQLFDKNNIPEKEEFSYFLKAVCFSKQRNYRQAEAYMSRAVQIAAKSNQDYLSFQFLSHLGFIQIDVGDYIDAIYNYRLATVKVRKLRSSFKDDRREASLNINISDLFYKSGLYAESLNYLNKAWALLDGDTASKHLLSSVIFYNISENYFRMNKLDSLIAYHARLNSPENKNYKLYTYRKRTEYYISLLEHKYSLAIGQINALKTSKEYAPSDLEDQHLADAYFANNQLDSAEHIVNRLLLANKDANHPEIKQHLYELLGQIAEKRDGENFAALNFKKALAEARQYNAKLTQVGIISSQIKLDETESSYIKRAEIYERERIWLIFIVVIAALVIVAIALIYRNVKQKRHYEMLLFAAKKEELAFINSHEVRKHLTNILGIIDILKNSNNKPEEYEQVEPYLQESAAKLDEAIRSISEKLND